MAKKDGMYLYCDWLAPFEKLDRAEVGELVIAMMKYYINGEKPPKFSGLCGMAADFIFPQIDRSMEYARLGMKSKGVSRARVTKKDPVPEETESAVCEEYKPSEPVAEAEEDEAEPASAYYPAPDPALDPIPEKRKGAESHVEEMFRKQNLESRFYRFWREYPKKVGKQQALSAFEKLDPGQALLCDIVDAVRRQRETYRWKKDNGQFIPYPAKWLEERRWEDEIECDPPDSATCGGGGIKKSEASSESSFDAEEFFRLAEENVRRLYPFDSYKLSDGEQA